MAHEPIDEYGAAIGSVFEARSRYETVCVSQGADSWAAQQALEYLEREIAHRNELRRRHDEVAYGRQRDS